MKTNAPATSTESLSVQSVTDDLIGGLMIGTGGIAAAAVMKTVNGTKKINPLLVAVLTLALGIATRIASGYLQNKKIKESIRDLSAGIIAAGSIDTAIKTLDTVYPSWRSMLPESLRNSLPAALGAAPYTMSYNVPTANILNGMDDINSNMLNGDVPQEAQVISSAMLN